MCMVTLNRLAYKVACTNKLRFGFAAASFVTLMGKCVGSWERPTDCVVSMCRDISLSFLHLGYISGIAARSTYLLDVTVYWCCFLFNTAAFRFVARQSYCHDFTLSMAIRKSVRLVCYLFTSFRLLCLLLRNELHHRYQPCFDFYNLCLDK